MSTKFKTIITTAGAEKLAAATVPGGKKVNITVMAVGDGGGTLPEPNAAQTKLINEVWRHALNKISKDSRNNNYIVAELVIPPEVGGFWMRELGLYDDEGALIAVANMAESYKPELAEGSGRAQTCRMVIIVSSIASVELSIDSTMVMATQDYVDDKLAEHEKSRNHPDATLKEKGFVQLSSATDSTSEALAATPKAVKAACDIANGKYTAQDASTAQKGIVQLNSATDSSDETQAATPKAVKIAMDNANARLAKERNGGDIPNKPLFVQNIGLQDTVNKAAGSLQKDQNLNDIPDKAQARNALQLGTAATATLTTSTTDDATGRVLKVGDRGLGKGAIPALRGFDFYQYWFAAGETLFIETNSAINFPPGMPEFANTYVYV
ncbi:TPA: phage tail protein, partial [Citrobacter freundii]